MKEFYALLLTIFTYFWRFDQNSVTEKSGLILMNVQGKDSKCLAKHHSSSNNPRTSSKSVLKHISRSL